MRFLVLSRGEATLDDGWVARAAGHGVAVLAREVARAVESATTVRDGSVVSAGPGADADGPVGGVVLLDASDLDAVLDVLPAPGAGAFEIRPAGAW